MAMFSTKPKFNLAEFLAESAPKKKSKPKALARKKSSKVRTSQAAKTPSLPAADTQE